MIVIKIMKHNSSLRESTICYAVPLERYGMFFYLKSTSRDIKPPVDYMGYYSSNILFKTFKIEFVQNFSM